MSVPRINASSIDEHKALTRSALLESAKKLIAEVGSADVPLGEVALAAGVGRTTLYDYFTDREDLIATLVEEELPSVLGGLIEDAAIDAPAAQRLALLATRTVEFVVNDPVLGVILHRDVGRMSVATQERVRNAHSSLSEAMVGLYFSGVESGELRSMPPDLAGRLIHDTIMSAAKTVISSPEPQKRIESVTENLRYFLLGGLGAGG